MQNKSIDLLGGIPGKTISKIKDDSSVHIQTSDLPNNISLFMNQSNNQDLQSKELRQALSEAIDRNTLVNQVLGGYATPEKNILGENKQNKNLQDIISTLTSSSFIFKNGVLYSSTKKTAKDIGLNKPVVIKLTTIDNVEIKETANFVATEWKKIGVETNIEVVDRKNVASLVKDRSFEILLFGFSVKENNDYNAFFNSKERTYPKLNISNFANKNVDKILENLNQNKNGLTSLSQELEDNMPVIILYKPKYIFASRLLTQTLINPFLKNEEDRYLSINNWYVKTEKVLSIWKNIPFIDNLDIILN